MLSSTTVVAFLGVAALLAVIPGPSVLFVVGRSVARGRLVGLLTVLGADIGLLVLVISVAFGVGALIAASEVAYWVIKVGGIAYLVYLGVQSIRHRKTTSAAVGADVGAARVLGEAFVVGVTNPKTVAILTAVLPQFVNPSVGPVWSQLLLLGVIFWGLALVSDSAWALTAGTASTWFARSPRRREALAAAGGGMMIALGGIMALTKRTA